MTYGYKCPFCNADPFGHRWRDSRGDVWHGMECSLYRDPCYERNRATPAEIAEEQENKYQADRYAGRVD